jgi:RNA polymerase sigma-70 factor, ECF subfamily
MRHFAESRPPANPSTPDPVAAADDWALWRRACQGHAPSATRLVRQLTPQAFGLAIQLLGKSEDAQDAVQDAFLRLWRSAPSDTHGARLATYFNTIVVNRCRTARARRREQATDPQDLADLHDAATAVAAPADAPAGEHLAGFRQGGVAGRLRRAVAALPARQRQAIALWAWADADAGGIARALDVDANAAHQLLHRARQALRRCLEETDR